MTIQLQQAFRDMSVAAESVPAQYIPKPEPEPELEPLAISPLDLVAPGC